MGNTWQSLCGPINSIDINVKAGFYQKGNYIFASENQKQQGDARLWVNTTGVAIGPRMFLTSQNNTQQISSPPGGSATFLLHTPKTFAAGFTADSVSVTLTFDSDLVTYLNADATPGWSVHTMKSLSSLLKLKLIKLSGTTLQPDSVICKVNFQTNLAKNTSGSVSMQEIDWDADSSYFDCIAQSLSSTDSVLVNVTLSCADSILRAGLDDELSSDILSVSPNPASQVLNLNLNNNSKQPITYQLFSTLGNIVQQGSTQTSLQLNVSTLPSGSYYLRMSTAGFVQTRRVVIER